LGIKLQKYKDELEMYKDELERLNRKDEAKSKVKIKMVCIEINTHT